MKILGWVLIGYGILPFIFFICAIIFIPPESISPISPTSPGILRTLSLPRVLILLFYLSGIIPALVPLCSLVGGIAILKLKKWGRKFILVIFSASIISKLIWLSISLSNSYLTKIAFSSISRVVSFCLYTVFEIVIIYLLIKNPITKQSS